MQICAKFLRTENFYPSFGENWGKFSGNIKVFRNTLRRILELVKIFGKFVTKCENKEIRGNF